MIQPQPQDELREWLEDEVGQPVSDGFWAYVENHGILQDVEYGIQPRSALVQAFDEIRAANVQRPLQRKSASRADRKTDESEPEGDRWRTISFLLKIEAIGKEKEVHAFRKDVLNDKLLKPEEIKNWMYSLTEEYHGTRRIASHLIPADRSITRTAEGYRIEPPIEISEASNITVEELAFFENGVDGDVGSMAVKPGGVFDRLRALCDGLARRYSWTIPQAVSFVLADSTPILEPFQWSLSFRMSLTSLSRIHMTVDPTLSPNDVAEAYSKIRRQVVGERHRELSRKHMHLAVFDAGAPSNWTWEKKMKEWNARQKNDNLSWRYESRRNFSRDCTRARERLLAPEFNVNL